jgi:hypothetical protein
MSTEFGVDDLFTVFEEDPRQGGAEDKGAQKRGFSQEEEARAYSLYWDGDDEEQVSKLCLLQPLVRRFLTG